MVIYHLLLLFNHVVIVVKLFCVEGLMEDRCTFNKHSLIKVFIIIIIIIVIVLQLFETFVG